MINMDNLYDYVYKLTLGAEGKELYHNYKEDIEKVSPRDAFVIFNKLLDEGMDIEKILYTLDKVINVFYKNLKNYPWEKPDTETFSWYLLMENKALIDKLEEMKVIIKNNESWFEDVRFIEIFNDIKTFPVHYTKKENILFPIMERKNKEFNGLKIMWALHDEGRKTIKAMDLLLKESNKQQITEMVGKLFFVLYGLVQKEELILFPIVSEIISKEEEGEMLEQSLDYDYFFVEKPILFQRKKVITSLEDNPADTLINRFLLLFDSLPVDITYVDEHNKVRYFNRPKDRFFPRSEAIIGRDVENCHPPDSVHVVLEIIDSFRNGSKDKARFWITMKGKILLIEYFAVRDEEGIYKGTLEVSQDITEIQKLSGEKRLLQWE